ncbi:MAG: pilus assembly protein PilM [Patescibacteria group bacterium]|nr:pilus assembly protein PilM [Patescibacteria group bacterium]
MINFFGQEPIIGIDLSDYSIEVIAMDRSGHFYNSRILIPKGLIEAGEIIQPESVVFKIKKALDIITKKSNENFSKAKVLASLPDSRVYIYTFTLPADLGEKYILAEIKRKVEKILPTDFSNLYWNYHVYKNSKKQEVVFAGAPKRIVESYQKTFAAAGLRLAVLDIESLSLSRAFLSNNNNGNSLIIDIGHRTTNLSIFNSQNHLKLSGLIRLGGRQITKSIMTGMNINRESAENIKRTVGLSDKNSAVHNLITDRLKILVSGTKDLIDYYEQKSNKPIMTVILAGGTALIPEIDLFLKNKLNKNVVLGKFDSSFVLSEEGMVGKVDILFANVWGLIKLGKNEKFPHINLLNIKPEDNDSFDDEQHAKKTGLPTIKMSADQFSFKFFAAVIFAVICLVILIYLIYSQIYQPMKLSKKLVNSQDYSVQKETNNNNNSVIEQTPTINQTSSIDIASSTLTNQSVIASTTLTVSSTYSADEDVSSSASQLSDNKTAKVAETPTGWLNVREGPGSAYPILTKILPGETYRLLEESSEWCKIEIKENEFGWATKKYLIIQ